MCLLTDASIYSFVVIIITMALPIREKAAQMLFDALLDEFVADDVEQAAYEYSIDEADKLGVKKYWENPDFRRIYAAKMRSLVFNLRDGRNPGFSAKVLSGDIEPKELVRMTPYQIFPENWTEVFDKVAEKRFRFEVNNSEHVHEGAFQCGRCKNKKVSYTQMQTRSADEPMTQFFYCHNCGKRWKS